MYRPPPLRGRPALAGKRVLLIDRCQATREVRAAVLRTHAVEVHEAEELSFAETTLSSYSRPFLGTMRHELLLRGAAEASSP
jgi:hypothetical protein